MVKICWSKQSNIHPKAATIRTNQWYPFKLRHQGLGSGRAAAVEELADPVGDRSLAIELGAVLAYTRTRRAAKPFVPRKTFETDHVLMDYSPIQRQMMKMKFLQTALVLCFAATAWGADNNKPVLQDKKQKTSYSMGYNIGNAWIRQGIEPSDVDLDILVGALKDVMAGKESAVSDQENRELLTAFQAELRNRREEKRKVQGEQNKKDGAAFLAENKTKPGVVTLPSGVQYKVLTEGTGPKPTTNDTVTVNYRGTLTDGTEFDSSYKRGQPASFKVTGVIKGWTEALQLMPTGSKWQVVIPAEMAYGERGSGAVIGPHATLVFEVELLSIQPAEKTAAVTLPQQPVTSDIIKVPSAEELKRGAKIEIIKADQLEAEKEKEKQRLQQQQQEEKK